MKKTIRHNLIILFSSLSVFIVVLLLTNPAEKGFLFTLVPISLIWMMTYSSVHILITSALGLKRGMVISLASSIASVVSLLAIFSALGDISFIDFILLTSLAVLLNFYLIRTWPN